jgi:hypothetical protein
MARIYAALLLSTASSSCRGSFAPRIRASCSMTITTATAKSFLSTPANSQDNEGGRCALHSAFLAGEADLSFFFIQSSPYECRRVAASTPAPHCVSAPDAASARDGRPLSLREPPSSDRAFQSGSTRDGRIDLTVDSLRPGPSRSTQLILS